MARIAGAFLLALVLLPLPEGHAQSAPKYEFRGAWVTTVLGLDWPSSRSASTADKKGALTRILDSLKAVGVNAVLFQVRPESDALYASELEPWSYWLTGEQGRAPEPFFDPLRFAVQETHKRGMELHAWFNPFRAARPGSGYDRAPSHVTNEHPDWLLTFDDGLTVLNPGLPAVRDYVTRVIMDVVRRYDVDGVHFDDYFYPYPPNEMAPEANQSKDQDAFEQHPRGFDNIENWRRDNVNTFVAQVHDSIQAEKPTVAFGISPFGIWKSGVPSGISGLSAYHTIYADAVAWLDAGTVDYLAPQLYWGFGGGQDYAALAEWWGAQAHTNGRHLYPGLAVYKAAPSARRKAKAQPFSVNAAATLGAKAYAPNVVPRQVRLNRETSTIQGSLFFRSSFITDRNPQGLKDSLRHNLYPHPALTPSFSWESDTAPSSPENLSTEWAGAQDQQLRLQWESGASAPTDRYAVYRVQAETAPSFHNAPDSAKQLLGVTGRTTFTDRPRQAETPYHYTVTAVSDNSVESAPSPSVTAQGRATPDIDQFAIRGNAPNPFTDQTRIRLSLPNAADVTVTVYDILGRAIIRTRSTMSAGASQALPIDGAHISPGVYLYRVTARMDDGTEEMATGKMVRVK